LTRIVNLGAKRSAVMRPAPTKPEPLAFSESIKRSAPSSSSKPPKVRALAAVKRSHSESASKNPAGNYDCLPGPQPDYTISG